MGLNEAQTTQLSIPKHPKEPWISFFEDIIRLSQMAKWTLHLTGCLLVLILYVVHERHECDQILRAKRSPSSGDQIEGVQRRKARPLRRYGTNVAFPGFVPDPISVPTASLTDQDKPLASLRMKGMRDLDLAHRIVGAGCI